MRATYCEQCFGPLEVSYDHSALDDAARAAPQDPGGPAVDLALRRLPARSTERPKVALEAGFTPLIRSERLAERLGLGEVCVKNDAANPTHSFKDRVVSVAVAKAKELGYETIACASTGNLANAVAAHAAAAGLESYVFVPADLEEQKILATGVYGTNLVAVNGNYDDVNRLCTELSGEHPWAFVNVNLRPYYAEGSKTLAFEVCGAARLRAARPRRVPGRLRARCSPRSRAASRSGSSSASWRARCRPSTAPRRRAAARSRTAFANGHEVCRPVRPNTIAKSLAIGEPGRRRVRARRGAPHRAARSTRSRDEEIVDGIRLLAETTGHLHRDRRRRDDRGAREAGRARRHRRRTTAWCSTSPATA